ncbi:MAG TPA: vitamin K epoxide reductase family protein [Kofleriaceae bacterium]|nr:vitamin K epoxide reductase family protein [Kofleriaceae bacterium]
MRRQQPWLVLVLAGAVIGVVFAAISTYDFVQHLDRQVHSLHCSFIPGVSHGAGESGCQVAMMSPYSSVLRTHVWGGVPIALGALSVFAFLLFYTLDLVVTRRKDDPRATGFLALATALPAVTSAVMLAISLGRLGTTCKLCVCIYLASALCLAGGILAWRRAAAGGGAPEDRGGRLDRHDRHHGEPQFVGTAKAPAGSRGSSARLVAIGAPTGTTPTRFLATMFGIGVAFVAVPVVLYLAMAPDHARFIGTCEGLAHPEDSYGVMVRIERGGGKGAPVIEVLDPLCPACKAFEQRLAASGLADQLERKAVMFPLDNTCNWMVTEATHPGACTISEAVLCAGDKAPDVIAWAFEEQARIRDETRADPGAAARIVKQRFPELAACVGSPDARSRLNKSMRWIVANNLRVLTPQVFIDGVKLCDEDVDLGLEYTLARMLDRHARHALATVPLEKPPAGKAASKPESKPDARAEGKPDGKPAGKPAGSAGGGTPAGTADGPAGSRGGAAAGSPGGTSADSPAGSREGAAAGTSAGAPAGSRGGAAAGTPGGTSAGAPGDTPAGSRGGTPAGSPGGTPEGSSEGAPVGSSGGTP